MRIEAREHPPGKTFLLAVTGQEPISRGLVLLAVGLGVGFVGLTILGRPELPGGLSVATQQQILGLLTLLQAGLAISCGVVVAVCLHASREKSLQIVGNPDGGLEVHGSSLEEGARRFPPEFGPYSLAVIRRLASVTMGSVDIDQQHLLASAQDDSTADETLANYVLLEVAVLDRNANRHTLLETQQILPAGTEEALQRVRAAVQGQLESLKGGGFVLKFPREPASP